MHCNVYTLQYFNVPEMLILEVSLREELIHKSGKPTSIFTESTQPMAIDYFRALWSYDSYYDIRLESTPSPPTPSLLSATSNCEFSQC